MAHVTGHPNPPIFGAANLEEPVDPNWPSVGPVFSKFLLPPNFDRGGFTPEERAEAARIGLPLGEPLTIPGTRQDGVLTSQEGPPLPPPPPTSGRQSESSPFTGGGQEITPFRPSPHIAGGPMTKGSGYRKRQEETPKTFEFVSSKHADDVITNLMAVREKRGLFREEEAQLAGAFKYLAAISASDAEAKFSNEMVQKFLPLIFSQEALATEQDREHRRKMDEYLADQRRYQEKQNRDTADRKSMFSLIPTLFPNLNLDLSEFGGEMDPELLPALIQMAQLRASERSQRDAQQVARPIVRFA